MTHPGMAFVFVVGIGLATILYYIFNDSNSNINSPNNQPQQNSSHTNNITKDLRDESLIGSRNKRKGSAVGTDKENCTICLMEITVQQIVNVLPCGHPFHMKCIQDWRQQGQMESHRYCPNCRRLIENVR